MIFKNFAITTVATAPITPLGTSLTVASSGGDLFPDTPFNATVWPIGELPISTNAEIVRVTDITGDVFTIERMQEDSKHRIIQFGDKVAATITAKTAHDIKDMNTVNTSGSYVIQDLDDLIISDSTSNTNIDLPVATGSGRTIRLKNVNTGTAYLRPNGFDNIDGENLIFGIIQWEAIYVNDYAVGEWVSI